MARPDDPTGRLELGDYDDGRISHADGRLLDSVLEAFDTAVAAAGWLSAEHGALVAAGRRLADAMDDTTEYAALARLVLEFRQVCRSLGLTFDPETAGDDAPAEVSPLRIIKDSG